MKFTSKHNRLKIVMEPSNHIIRPNGERKYVPGVRIEFQDGEYETTDNKIINHLVNHKDYGYRFFSPEYDEEVREKLAAQQKKREELAKKTDGKATNKKSKKSKK